MIFRFERTRDYVLVKYILTQPSIYKHMVADGAPPADRFKVSPNEDLWYMLALQGDQACGLFILDAQTDSRWEVHACFLPHGWGHAVQAYKQGLSWVWRNTSCRVLMGYTPADNRLALAVAKRAGMRQIATVPGSLMRNGKPIDEVIFMIERDGNG